MFEPSKFDCTVYLEIQPQLNIITKKVHRDFQVAVRKFNLTAVQAIIYIVKKFWFQYLTVSFTTLKLEDCDLG